MTKVSDWPRCMVGALTDDRCPQAATQYTRTATGKLEAYFWCDEHGYRGAAKLDAASLAELAPIAAIPIRNVAVEETA